MSPEDISEKEGGNLSTRDLGFIYVLTKIMFEDQKQALAT
jgi:hypothetical protein